MNRLKISLKCHYTVAVARIVTKQLRINVSATMLIRALRSTRDPGPGSIFGTKLFYSHFSGNKSYSRDICMVGISSFWITRSLLLVVVNMAGTDTDMRTLEVKR